MWVNDYLWSSYLPGPKKTHVRERNSHSLIKSRKITSSITNRGYSIKWMKIPKKNNIELLFVEDIVKRKRNWLGPGFKVSAVSESRDSRVKTSFARVYSNSLEFARFYTR